MRDHLLNSNTLRKNCYCGKDLSENIWKSEFHGEKHYKTTICECGSNITVEVDFSGSGHDGWDGKNAWEEEIAELDRIIQNAKRN